MATPMMNAYLEQQQRTVNMSGGGPAPSVHSVAPSEAGSSSGVGATALTVVNNVDNMSLDEFKAYVREWLGHDNFIKKAQEVIKEKRKARDKLSEVITAFMVKYQVEDLRTKEGRIRCKVSQVKAPVNQKVVKQRIMDYYGSNENQSKEILEKIYAERESVEKVSLRRLKVT